MNRTFILLAILVFFVSCDPNKVYEEYEEIPEYLWDVKNQVEFEVNIPDILPVYDFYINVRHASHYPFSNLFIFITTKLPDGATQKDTAECILADDKGKWLGDGLGDIYDIQILFKKQVRLPNTGKYIFSFEQAMRSGSDAYIEQLPGIMDIGLRIEKSR